MNRRQTVVTAVGAVVVVTVLQGTVIVRDPAGGPRELGVGQQTTIGAPAARIEAAPPAPPAPQRGPASPAAPAPDVEPPQPGAIDERARGPGDLVVRAEAAFEAGDAEEALALFREMVEDHPDHGMAPYALYKLAWAEMNTGDLEGAIRDLDRLEQWFDQGSVKESPMNERLRDEAARDREKMAGWLEERREAEEPPE